MNKRVVITGMGVVSPNGIGIPAFLEALQTGKSGVKFVPLYEELKFSCNVAGRPDFIWEELQGNYISDVTFYGLKGTNIGYGIRAALDAWRDAGLSTDNDDPLWHAGLVFGNSTADTEAMRNVITRVDNKEAKKLGSRVVEQTMNSGVSAYISGRLGLGNRIITNSSACATGSQAILMAYEYIKNGYATTMLTGSCEHVDTYVYGAFDSMRVLSRKFNNEPERASRPMSLTAGGFVPGSGAGALVLEELETALARGATIYAEVLGGATNNGGQRQGGTMTAANQQGVVRCINDALNSSNVRAHQIDLISGHLTATYADKAELNYWATALNRRGDDYPYLNSLKSMIGHCLSAAGSIESVAAVLQLKEQFIHPNINLEDIDPGVTEIASIEKIPVTTLKKDINIVAKANFGFGDVNACLLFSKYK